MKTRAKTIWLAFTMASLTLTPFAEAARMGKGRTAGMQRTAPAPAYQRQAAPPPQQQAGALPTAPGQTQPRQGPGIGTAVAAGAVGAVAGYALGSAMNDNKTQSPSPQTQNGTPGAQTATENWGQPTQAGLAPSGTPWGLILILGALFVGGLIWFRRRVAPPLPNQGQGGLEQPTRFAPIPTIGSGTPGSNAALAQDRGLNIQRLTDGTETPHFLRQAKATFLHLQSLNSPDSLEEVRKYMTNELFESLRDDIINNSEIADFPTLNCQLIESIEEEGRHVASVRFGGMVSEAVNANPVPFTETWHYIKDPTTQNKWLVAGIQQE